MRKTLAFILFAVTISGCAVFKPGDFDNEPDGFPSQFSMYSEKNESAALWWNSFNSEELNSLMDKAIKKNFSIQEAWARLAQSRYAALKAGADQFPDLSVTAGGSRLGAKTKGLSRIDTDEWSLGFTTFYEVDLWGRVRAEKTSSHLLADASEQDLKSAVMTVTGKIAENWINLISLNKQQELFTKQLELQNKLLQIIQLRFTLAKSTALDIYQQQQSIEKIKAALIPLQSNLEITKRQLALLAGKVALDDTALIQKSYPKIGEIPAIGLPADLLAARPDIRAAGLRLKSAQWEIAAAKADRLPALRLTASHTYLAEETRSIFDNWLLNLAANMTGPILDGGRRRMEVARTKAIVDERLATYSKIVFTAVKEVEDAMTEEDRYARTIESLKRQHALSENSIREARTRYLTGNSDFLNVLREELNMIQVQQDIITAEEKMIIARIQLYKALGGSWIDTYFN
jgi:NodT family efflux transporter outer membrane factor (OMF) lipoprotein